jgi:spermidine synthase
VLVPQLGLLQTGFITGLFNVGIAGLAIYVFRTELITIRPLIAATTTLSSLLLIGVFASNGFTSHMENKLYQDEIIYSQDTPFQQRLILTRRNERIRFYINGALQFDSFDEYRYHEPLIHPVMGLVANPQTILILGGGDGLAARELLRYAQVQQIHLVDLDPAVTHLFAHNKLLTPLNKQSLTNSKVTVFNQDAWKYLENTQQLYDAIFIDLPDPNNTSLSKLYSSAFYSLVKQHLAQDGVLVTQATSPLYSRQAFWCIDKTLQLPAGEQVSNETWHTLPYHVHVPSFGEWGFVMAARKPLKPSNIQLAHLDYQFLTPSMLPQLFDFPADMSQLAVETNHLINHPLLDYYEKGWKDWYQQ